MTRTIECGGANPTQFQHTIIAVVEINKEGETAVTCPQMYTNTRGEKCCKLGAVVRGNLCIQQFTEPTSPPQVIITEVFTS